MSGSWWEPEGEGRWLWKVIGDRGQGPGQGQGKWEGGREEVQGWKVSRVRLQGWEEQGLGAGVKETRFRRRELTGRPEEPGPGQKVTDRSGDLRSIP